MNNHFFYSAEEFNKKFTDFIQHTKKIKALENISACKPFKHFDFLNLIKACIKTSFLDEKEDAFLTHMLDKQQIHYLQWCYKTKKIKQQMASFQQQMHKPKQLFINFEGKQAKIDMPINRFPMVHIQQGTSIRV